MKFPRAILFAAASFGALVSCHTHSSASFSFDASFGFVDAGSPVVAIDAGEVDAGDVDGGAPATVATASDFSLRFERTACLGTCPMYVVHVDAHGAVRFSSRLYVQDRFVDRCASKNIGDQGIGALESAIAKYGYFSLKNAYSGGPTDAPSVITTVTMNGKTKTVNHYAAAPIAAADKVRLDGLEDAIDRISGAADFASQSGALKPCKYGPPTVDPL